MPKHKSSKVLKPFRLRPAYYAVQAGNLKVSLPTDTDQGAPYIRQAAYTRSYGSVYFCEIDKEKVLEENRKIRIAGEELPADFAVLYKPGRHTDQRWVAVSSVLLTEAGKCLALH